MGIRKIGDPFCANEGARLVLLHAHGFAAIGKFIARLSVHETGRRVVSSLRSRVPE